MLTTKNYKALAELKHPLGADALKRALMTAGPAERAGIVRLFVTEASPFAFADCPMAYEHLRSHLAQRLSLDAKHICLTGSARLGYSTPIQLKGEKRWGTPMSPGSDLDLFAVDQSLFERCLWDVDAVIEGHVESGKATEEEKLVQMEQWENKAKSVRTKAGERGMIDLKHLPRSDVLPTVALIGRTMGELTSLFKGLPFKLVPTKRPTLRLYNSWSAAVRQIERSLHKAAMQNPA